MMLRWLLAAAFALSACSSKSDAPASAAAQGSAAPVAAPNPVMTIPVCHELIQTVGRLDTCGKLKPELRATYEKLARDVQAPDKSKSEKRVIATCQLTIRMLRNDLIQDCPDLGAQVTDYPLP